MKILVLNGSPHKEGNTSFLVNAFMQGAKEAGHSCEQLRMYSMKIHGCLGCDYCRKNEEHACIQKDDMELVNRKILESDLIVFATPVYYFNFAAPLLAAIQRTYSIDIPKNVKQTALIYSAGSAFTGGPVFESYFHSIVEYWQVNNAGIWQSHGKLNRSEQKWEELYQAGLHLRDTRWENDTDHKPEESKE